MYGQHRTNLITAPGFWVLPRCLLFGDAQQLKTQMLKRRSTSQDVCELRFSRAPLDRHTHTHTRACERSGLTLTTFY